MLLMRLQCWCEVLMWLPPDDVTAGSASWLLSLMWDVVTDVGCCHWCRLKVVGWLISPLKFASNVYYCYCLPSVLIDQFISQFLWLIRWFASSPFDESYSQQSAELQLNSHVIDFDNSVIFPQSYWLIIVTQIYCTHKSSFWMGLSVGWQLMLMIFLLCKNV